MKKSLYTLLGMLFLFSGHLSAQTPSSTILYSPSNSQTQGGLGVGINVLTPEARLHLLESDDQATALKIDLAARYSVYGTEIPGLAIQVHFTDLNQSLTRIFSVDNQGKVKSGREVPMAADEQVALSEMLGIYYASNQYVQLGYPTSTPELTWSGNTNFKFTSEYSNTSPITFSSSGKVGINTDNFFGDHDLYVNGSTYIKGDSPEIHSLWIEGSAIAEEIFVKAEMNWPDYVFAHDYDLMPLSEVENYIKENSRLPGMASAEEVAKTGIKVGETQRMLTEKIEELTLYIIEQQKLLEVQRKEIDHLKTLIEKK